MADNQEKHRPRDFEGRLQERWERDGLYHADDFSSKPKQYVLVEFPYPSGEGLHVGHCLSYVAQDVVARYLRMKGNNVLYPIGWDAFGLPTENYAIKNKLRPQDATATNIANFTRQIKSLGISFDWSREINTTDPSYYRWTQWIFLQLLKAGLAEKKEMPINWCPSCKIGLAFEEVVDGKCERCGTPVERRTIKQWVLKITAYADRLIDDLATVDFLSEIKQQQINWIGRSEGALISFEIRKTNFELRSKSPSEEKRHIEVFTTRPDTLFGAMYLVIAPEVATNSEWPITNRDEVAEYCKTAMNKTDRERQEHKEKTGVPLQGIVAINPANGEELSVWVADYVLGGYGTGAIMAVPAHDSRDSEFAKKFDLPARQVIEGIPSKDGLVYEGTLINSGVFNGLSVEEGKAAITKHVGGIPKIQYKLRDWIFSRQHYWGEPIPVIHCDSCGYVPVPEKDLPVTLPDVTHYEPTDTGESPLAAMTDWVNVSCPQCGHAAKRETDTMPNWAGSSWYFLRYCDPRNETAIADKKKLGYWMPVDVYNGGAEHTTLHLLYSRFWHKFLYDQKVVTSAEPYQRRVQHGVVLAPDGQKMSKSRGNVINPDTIVNAYGADTMRLYILFMGEYDQVKSWSDDHLQGVHRFLTAIWNHSQNLVLEENEEILEAGADAAMNRAIQGVVNDIERRSFNTAISKLMICWNELSIARLNRKIYADFLHILAPFAPHIADELWQSKLGAKESIHASPWPVADASLLASMAVTIGVQVDGKVRGEISVTDAMNEKVVREAALSLPSVAKYCKGKAIVQFRYVSKRIVSIVTASDKG